VRPLTPPERARVRHVRTKYENPALIGLGRYLTPWTLFWVVGPAPSRGARTLDDQAKTEATSAHQTGISRRPSG
jgi:hypothetical protein